MTDENDYIDPRAIPYNLPPERLRFFDDMTMDAAPDLDVIDLLEELFIDPSYGTQLISGNIAYRVLTLALAFYETTSQASEFSDLHRLDVFGACLYQAMAIERGNHAG